MRFSTSGLFHPPPAPEYPDKDRFEFFRKFARCTTGVVDTGNCNAKMQKI
jgi:hypothetical protein